MSARLRERGTSSGAVVGVTDTARGRSGWQGVKGLRLLGRALAVDFTGGRSTRTRTPIGVDFGRWSMKLVQFVRRRDQWAAQAVAEARLPAELPAEGAQRVAMIAETLREMLRDSPVIGREVVSALPALGPHYKNLRLPPMPPHELAQAVQWEAADRLELDGDCQVQFFDAGEVRQGDELRRELIVMGAPGAQVREHLEVLLACELEPVAIEAAPSALARCTWAPMRDGGAGPAGAQETREPAATSMVIDLGHAATKVLIARHGRVLFFKLIDIGGMHLDDAVARQLKVSTGRAAELRRRALREDDAGESAAAVREALTEPVQQLAREIGLCQRYYSVTFRGARPQHVLAVGGESRYGWLTAAIGEGLGLTMERYDPFAGVDLSSVRDRLGAGEAGAVWAGAAGLAWREGGCDGWGAA